MGYNLKYKTDSDVDTDDGADDVGNITEFETKFRNLLTSGLPLDIPATKKGPILDMPKQHESTKDRVEEAKVEKEVGEVTTEDGYEHEHDDGDIHEHDDEDTDEEDIGGPTCTHIDSNTLFLGVISMSVLISAITVSMVHIIMGAYTYPL